MIGGAKQMRMRYFDLSYVIIRTSVLTEGNHLFFLVYIF